MKGFASKTDRKEIDLLEYVRIVIKRKWVVVTFAAVLVALAAVLSFTRTPLYRATATLLIDEPGSSMINIQDVLNAGALLPQRLPGHLFQHPAPSPDEPVARGTGLQEAQPRGPARVPGRGRVEGGPPAAGLRSVLTFRWLAGRGRSAAADGAKGSPGPSAASYAYAVQAGLSIAPIPETRLVYASYVSRHAALSADIVKALVEEFVSFSV